MVSFLFHALTSFVQSPGSRSGERAAKRKDARGPRTFLPALIDDVWKEGG